MAYNFKSEEDVKEFIENLGIEYRFGCIHEKKPEVCHLLGDYLEAISRNFQKALSVYKNNCDRYDYAHSCYKTGAYYMQGKGMDAYDDYKAMDYFEKGCRLGDYQACYRAGVLCFNSEKRVRDYTQGLAHYENACENKIGDSCFDLSVLYLFGNPDKNIPKDQKKAAQYSEKACDLRVLYGCFNLARMYKIGEGVKQSDELSQKYKSIATDIDNQMASERESIKFGEAPGST